MRKERVGRNKLSQLTARYLAKESEVMTMAREVDPKERQQEAAANVVKATEEKVEADKAVLDQSEKAAEAAKDAAGG